MEASYDEHLARSKARAGEYLDRGDRVQAFSSMVSDLRKHPGTRDHPGLEIGLRMLVAGGLKEIREMRDFIEGFR